MPICILPPEVADKIAAGEVVERPASVVKELVENSLDAGATEVQVTIREGGRRLIRVADDGGGIPEAEIELALARHATSKLSTAKDLAAIRTLGFRGEALASIAAVAQVTLLSRPRGQVVGRLIRVEGGQVTRREGRGSPAGTTVSVEHLFYNVPARLKFLRQPATEAGHIHDVLAHYALAYPELRFRLEVDGRLAFQSAGSGGLRDVLVAVYGLEVAEQMIPVSGEGPAHGVRVRGLVSQPSLHRATRTYISFFVNRRWIQDRSLAHAVAQAYHTLLPVGRHPVAVIGLELDPAQVDVNVHPTKREVRFRDGRGVFAAVQKAVRAALLEQAGTPAALHAAPREWPVPGDWGVSRPLAGHVGRSESQLALGLYRPGEPEPVGPVRLPLLRVIGQIGQTYIVAEGPQGLYLIDQHAAHERVLYEQVSAQAAGGQVASQALLEPAALDLLPTQAAALAENREALAATGFALEPFGGDTVLLRAMPTILGGANPAQALADVLDDLLDPAAETPLAGAAESHLIAAVCKRAAVKAGQTLSPAEMQELVRGLEQCANHRTCPHGRPTVVHFSVEQLEREFGRR